MKEQDVTPTRRPPREKIIPLIKNQVQYEKEYASSITRINTQTQINLTRFQNIQQLQEGNVEKKQRALAIAQGRTMSVIFSQKQLQGLIRKTKSNKIVREFIRKIRRNNSDGADFKLEKNVPLYYKREPIDNDTLKGFSMNVHYNSILTIVDITVTLLLFTLSAFQGFLSDFNFKEAKQDTIRTCYIICLIFLLFKNVIQMTKVTMHNQKVIYKIKQILEYRFSELIFILDWIIIIVLIFQFFIKQPSQQAGLVLFFLTLVKIFPLEKYIFSLEKTYLKTYKQFMWWNLMRMVIFNIFFAHFFGCILVSLRYLDLEKNWINNKGLQDEDWFQVYIFAYYWAATMMNGVGFGDISPVNYKAALIVAFLEVFSFAVCELIDVIRLDSILQIQADLKNKIGIFRANAKKDKIPFRLRKIIERFMEEQDKVKSQKFSYKERSRILQSLPDNLQREYLIDFNKKGMRRLPFFSLLTIKTRLGLALKLYEKTYYKDDIILQRLIGPSSVMILINGKISYCCRQYMSVLNGRQIHQIQVKQLSSNRIRQKPFLIDDSFLIRQDSYRQNQSINFDVKANTICKIFHIDLDDFYSVMRDNPKDRNYFFQIYHKHQIFPHTWQIIKCEYCPGRFHNLFDCPKFHYFPIKQMVYLKYLKPDKFYKNENVRNQKFQRVQSNIRKKCMKSYCMRDKYIDFQKLMGIHSTKKIKTTKRATFDLSIMKNNENNQCEEYKDEQDSINTFNTNAAHSQLKQLSLKKFYSDMVERRRKKVESSSIQSSPAPHSQSFQFQVISQGNLQKQQQNFFENEYMLKANREAFNKNLEQNFYRQIKIRLYDAILDKLSPNFNGFWELQIDKGCDFSGYFQQLNPSNLDYAQIGKMKLKGRRAKRKVNKLQKQE